MTHTFVTQPRMPPLDEFLPYLEAIWRNKQLTNSGPLHEQLEEALADYLSVDHIALVANGTIALALALQTLEHGGEVITTPFSFVATSNAILTSGLIPIFADVDPTTCNLDPDKVEAAITPRTVAILPVHCFGHPCDVARIEAIGKRHGVPVIYDAAHAFGVEYQGVSVLQHGAMSTLSFHATKVFSTFEGGAIVCRDKATKDRVRSLRNFGFVDKERVSAIGINGKMSEIHAAFGLLQLKHLADAIARRREISVRYRQGLDLVSGLTILSSSDGTRSNYGYFPVFVGQDYPLTRDGLLSLLAARGVAARRYFYPLISDMPAYQQIARSQMAAPNARRVADQILCLPIFPDLSDGIVDRIIEIVQSATLTRSAA